MLLTKLLMLAQLLGFVQAPSPTGDDLYWVETHLTAAREQLMPMGTKGLVAAYRATKDMFIDTAEQYFSIELTYPYPAAPDKEVLIATVTTPVRNVLRGERYAKSIREQLLELHMADRSASLETALMGANIRRTTLTVEQCPAIARQMNALRGMQITLPGARVGGPPKVPALHPTVHQLMVDFEGVYIRTSFTDPDVSLVQWSLQTLDDLNKCVTP